MFEVHCVYQLVGIHVVSVLSVYKLGLVNSYQHNIRTTLVCKILVTLTLWTPCYYGHPLSQTEATFLSEATKKCMGTTEIKVSETGNLQRVLVSRPDTS